MKKICYVALILMLCVTGCGGQKVDQSVLDGENVWAEVAKEATYPYSWEHKNDGSLEFKVTGEWSEEAVWNVEVVDNEVLTVEAVKEKKNSVTYQIKPVSEGSSMITLQIQEKDKPSAMAYAIRLNCYVNADNVVTILSAEAEEPQASSVDGGKVYTNISNNAGENTAVITIYDGLHSSEEEMSDVIYSWRDEITGGSLQLQGPMLSDGGYSYIVYGMAEGKTHLVLTNEALDVTLDYVVTVTKDNLVTVEEATAEAVKSIEAAEAEKEALIEKLLEEGALTEDGTIPVGEENATATESEE